MSVVHFLFLLYSISSFFILYLVLNDPQTILSSFMRLKKKKSCQNYLTPRIFHTVTTIFLKSKSDHFLPYYNLFNGYYHQPLRHLTSPGRAYTGVQVVRPVLLPRSVLINTANYQYWGIYSSPTLSSMTFKPLHSSTSQTNLSKSNFCLNITGFQYLFN